jgi:CBS domain containing-hemolysin-like protein
MGECDSLVSVSVPVFERRVDNIVGIAYAMDMLDYVEQVLVPTLLCTLLKVKVTK